jgi:hypothetical protein
VCGCRHPRPPPYWRHRAFICHHTELCIHRAWPPCFPDLLSSLAIAPSCASMLISGGRAPPLLRAEATTATPRPPPREQQCCYLVEVRCYHGGWGLLQAAADLAASGDQPSSNRRPPVLQMVCRPCYSRRPALLQGAVCLATIVGQRCHRGSRCCYMEASGCQRLLALLHGGGGAATMAQPRCCQPSPELLHGGDGTATMAQPRCYMDEAALLQWHGLRCYQGRI